MPKSILLNTHFTILTTKFDRSSKILIRQTMASYTPTPSAQSSPELAHGWKALPSKVRVVLMALCIVDGVVAFCTPVIIYEACRHWPRLKHNSCLLTLTALGILLGSLVLAPLAVLLSPLYLVAGLILSPFFRKQEDTCWDILLCYGCGGRNQI